MKSELKTQIDDFIAKYKLMASIQTWANGSSYFVIKYDNRLMNFELAGINTLQDFEERLEEKTGLIRLK